MKQYSMIVLGVTTFLFCVYPIADGFGFGYGTADDGGGDRVLLKDVQVITLHHGQYTNGRRSPGVPQLQCIGGSAGCHAYKPTVVQCKNVGSDGYDAQWECKSEMPNQFKFGQISVTCEGYSSPNDPYVLRGSCGLEYSLEYSSTHQHQHSTYYGQPAVRDHSKSSFGNLFIILAFAVIAVAIYYTCIMSPTHNNTNRGYPSGTTNRGGASAPPPPGFRSDFFPGNNDGFGDGCGSTSSSSYTHNRTYQPNAGTGTGGGFWTGAATGGLFGYMFGANSNRGDSSTTTHRRGYQDSYFSSPSSTFTASAPSPSSATQTSTGFGGTKRR